MLPALLKSAWTSVCVSPFRNLDITEARRLARENAKDIIACGFDVARTFIFSDFDYVGGAFYRNIVQMQKCARLNPENPVNETPSNIQTCAVTQMPSTQAKLLVDLAVYPALAVHAPGSSSNAFIFKSSSNSCILSLNPWRWPN